MTAKIFKSVFITAMMVFIASLLFYFFFSYDYYNDRLEEEVVREAEFLQKGYDEAPEGGGIDYLGSISRGGVVITLVDADGSVSFDTRFDDPSVAADHKNREEIREAFETGEGFSVRTSDTDGVRMIYSARRTNDGRVIRVGTSHYSITDLLGEIVGPALLLLLAAVLFAFLAAVHLSSSIVKPINEIDLDAPQSTKTYEELRPIIDKLASQNYRIAKQMNELRKREVEFNSITVNMSEGMIIINSRTAVLSCNAAARRILGAHEEDLAGGVLSLNSQESFRVAIGAALSGKNGYDTLRRGDKFYSILVTPVFNGARVDGAVIVIIDDTEKESREALRREFTANVSHELKTPLTSISGFAELIEGGIAEGEDAVRFAGNIRKEASRLITLVGDIIRLNQLDGGEIPYDEERVSLYEVADEVAARLEGIAERASVTVSVSGDHVYVDGNRQIIEEMIYNLTDNAIKYNKVGGRVEILIQKSEVGATLSVKDTGIGIPEDKLDRIFERFYRVDKSHSKDIGGTGLGLSIVKHGAAYHGAKISVESEYGVGTVLTLVFADEDQ